MDIALVGDKSWLGSRRVKSEVRDNVMSVCAYLISQLQSHCLERMQYSENPI
jgi:hypothetical protein